MRKTARVDISRPMRRAVIKATGSAVPDRVLDNAYFEKILDTSDDWITTRTGIKQRRIISDGESTASLAIAAARQALARSGLAGQDLDAILCATITPEMVFPSTACFVQDALKNPQCCAFDLAAACSGYIYAAATASAFIATGQARNVLILGAETLSNITDYTERSSCILFGDGAGAALLQPMEDTDRGVLYSSLHADGGNWEPLSCQAYGSRHPSPKPLVDKSKVYMRINGREVYQLAVRRIVEMIEKVYRECGLCNDDIALVIPHQMNLRIMESAAKRLDLPSDKMYVNIDRFGNTSSASIAIAMDQAVQDKSVKLGDLIIWVAFGAGLTWGVNLIRF